MTLSKGTKVMIEPIDDVLTTAAIVTLLVARARDPADTVRQAKDKFRKRLLYAEASGELLRISGLVARCPDGRWKLGPVVAWARVIWPGKFNDLPTHYRNQVGEVLLVQANARGRITIDDLPRLQQTLADTEVEVGRLQTALQLADAELVLLRPLAEHKERIRQARRDRARLPRKRRNDV